MLGWSAPVQEGELEQPRRRWGGGVAHQEGVLLFRGAVEELPGVVETIRAVAAWARRRAGPQLVAATSDPKGWSSEFHAPSVLQSDAKFKGAVWDVENPACPPDGVLLFHNSPFSNWHTCGQQVRLRHGGRDFGFSTSEHVIMAFKEHLLAGTPLEVALTTHTGYRTARESKEAAGRATRRATDYTWWSHHGMHVVVGSVACWLKFSQDAGLERLLLSTQQALLVETAPNDGSWGVAMNSSEFLRSASPADFALPSTACKTLSFDVGTLRIKRPHCEANALGKSLMITRALLASGKRAMGDALLGDTIALVAQQMQAMEVPFDSAAAVERLAPS